MTLTKGRVVGYNPIKRTKGERVDFQFNPSEITVDFEPNYVFNTAPVGSSAYAQYGNSSPVKLRFALFLRTTYDQPQNLTTSLYNLRQFIEPEQIEDLTIDLDKAPPMVQLILGDTFQWMYRPLYGVFSAMEVKITKQSRTLAPLEATVDVTFIESRISSLSIGGS